MGWLHKGPAWSYYLRTSSAAGGSLRKESWESRFLCVNWVNPCFRGMHFVHKGSSEAGSPKGLLRRNLGMWAWHRDWPVKKLAPYYRKCYQYPVATKGDRRYSNMSHLQNAAS